MQKTEFPEIKFDDILDTTSDDDENFFSPITQPKLITSKKCNDKQCYFCEILKSDCSGKDISIFKKK